MEKYEKYYVDPLSSGAVLGDCFPSRCANYRLMGIEIPNKESFVSPYGLSQFDCLVYVLIHLEKYPVDVRVGISALLFIHHFCFSLGITSISVRCLPWLLDGSDY